jgi:hypothetical protein
MTRKCRVRGSTRAVNGAVVAGVVLGAALGLAACGGSTGPSASSPPARIQPGAAECGKYVQQKPQAITLACSEGNVEAARLQWTDWSTRHASGSGVVNVNYCLPTCAKGTVQGYPATFALSVVKRVGGRQAFTVLTATYTGARPFDGTGPYGTRTFRQGLLSG